MEAKKQELRAKEVTQRSRSMPLGAARSVVASEVDASRQTNFKEKLAAELWLNLDGREYRLVGKTIRIGRSSDNDIVIDHRSCSRYHALIAIEADHVTIEDLKSRNGIKVNGSAVRRAELKDGDIVKVGDLKGIFYQRLRDKNYTSEVHEEVTNAFKKILPMVAGFRDRFESLDKRAKLGVVAAAMVLGLVLAANLFKGATPSAPDFGQVEAASTPVVDEVLDLRQFEQCLEHEDLGNFRQAVSCLKKLPYTAKVQGALKRVQETQNEFVTRRLREASQARENHYYDVAILKWQEVLLTADETSDSVVLAKSGIEEAERMMRAR